MSALRLPLSGKLTLERMREGRRGKLGRKGEGDSEGKICKGKGDI